MKNIIYLFVYLFIISCRSQNFIKIDTKYKDVILFTSQERKLTYIYGEKIYDKNDLIIALEEWIIGDGMQPKIYKYYSFVQNKDTMNVECKCGQERNYYFKNLEFKKGNYELSFDFGKQYNEQTKRYETIRPLISGSQIENLREVQNILFKNTYVPEEHPSKKDVYFKDLKFYEINLKDTINVKLKKVNQLE